MFRKAYSVTNRAGMQPALSPTNRDAMYTLKQLQTKTFNELKKIGWELNLLPAGDRRCRQSWIDAITGVKPPLLEVSPGVEVEPVAEAIEVQAQEPPIESKFGRIVYPKPAAEPIAQVSEISPGVSFDVEEFRETHAAEIDAYVASFSDESRPPNRGTGDRGRLESEPKVSQSAIAPADKNPRSVDRNSIAHELLVLFKSSARIIQEPIKIQHQEPIEIQHQEAIENSPGVTFSPRFLALYPPPFCQPSYEADDGGQLNLLKWVDSEEPPDPDDFASIGDFWVAMDCFNAWHSEWNCECFPEFSDFCDCGTEILDAGEFVLDASQEALAPWDAENPEPLTVSVDSMTEWALCPEDWYEPAAEILPLKAPSMHEVLELSPAIETIEIVESFSSCELLIPFFGAAGDRQNDKDEPPDAGSFARLPKPKPPGFPPRTVVAGDRPQRIKKFARSAIPLSGRSPPGGDARSF